MSVNSLNIANALATVLSGIDGLQGGQFGAPVSVGEQVTYYIAMGRRSRRRKTTGTNQHEINMFVCFCYRVDGNEVAAETTLMSIVDDFEAALDADLTLGGVVDSLDYSSLSADEPEYRPRSGKEYREYPMIVSVTQQSTYEVNP